MALSLRRWLTERLFDFLTQPLPHYERRGWNDLDRLKKHIRKGDVLLVEGDSRVSTAIKYLSQSSWSHSALYIGDELVRRGGQLGESVVARHGDEAAWLLVEALPQGVVASPVSKYIDFNIRLCRPHQLRPEHVQVVMEEAVAAFGLRYDLRNVLDLARYLLPVSLVPRRLRRTALHFGSRAPTEVICSSLIGHLFHKVRFPILPTVEFPKGFDAPAPTRPSLLRRVFGHESSRFTGLFRMRHPTLLTPRDFDLSPHFEIVKFNMIADGDFDYQRIHWADEFPELAAGQENPDGETGA
jgi:hypothetical protein